MSKLWKKWYECDCTTEGIMLSSESEDDNISLIDLAFFSNNPIKLTLKQRMRYCWKTLITGMPFVDMVCLNKKTASELGKDLTKWSKKQ